MSAEPDPEADEPPGEDERGEPQPRAAVERETTDDGVVVFRAVQRDGPPTEGHWLTLAHMERIEEGEVTLAELLAEECARRGLPEPSDEDVEALAKAVDEMLTGVRESAKRYLASQTKMLEFAKNMKIDLPKFDIPDIPASVLGIQPPPSLDISPELLAPPRLPTLGALEELLDVTASNNEATLGVLQAMEADIKGLRDDAASQGRFDARMAWAILIVALATLVVAVVGLW